MNDWSTHLIQAEKTRRWIEDKLLHKRRDGIKEDIYAVIEALYSTLAWAENNPDK